MNHSRLSFYLPVFLFRYLRGRVFVLDLTPGSQADFDKFICRGDVIDEINGTSLRNSKSGQVPSKVYPFKHWVNSPHVPNPTLHSSFKAGVVLSRLKGCPLSLSVVRWRAQDGTVFRPLIKLLQVLRMENPDLQLGPTPPEHPSSNGQISSPTQCLKDGRQVGHWSFINNLQSTLNNTNLPVTGLCTGCS